MHYQLECVSLFLILVVISADSDLPAEYVIGGPRKKDVPWIRLLDHLFRNNARLIGWVPGVPPPGPNFKYKTIKTEQLKALIVTVNFELWTAGTFLAT